MRIKEKRLVEARFLARQLSSEITTVEQKQFTARISRLIAEAEKLYLAGVACENAGQLDGARQSFEQAKEIAVDFPGLNEACRRVADAVALKDILNKQCDRGGDGRKSDYLSPEKEQGPEEVDFTKKQGLRRAFYPAAAVILLLLLLLLVAGGFFFISFQKNTTHIAQREVQTMLPASKKGKMDGQSGGAFSLFTGEPETFAMEKPVHLSDNEPFHEYAMEPDRDGFIVEEIPVLRVVGEPLTEDISGADDANSDVSQGSVQNQTLVGKLVIHPLHYEETGVPREETWTSGVDVKE
ncbi:MAG: hypothetical protein GQ559_04410 [Desulfobulbaceae bacterium]|nr:hypothetical protein [Desulfobulbaceae bacterium]